MSSTGSGLTWFAGWDRRGGGGREQGAAARQLTPSQWRERSGTEVYDLLAVAGRGFRPPELLTIAHAANEDPPWDHVGEKAGLSTEATELRQAWSLLYQLIAESNPREDDPYAIYLLGVNPPDGATDQDLEVFNDFYTNVHLREVAERRHALRAVRYQLVRSVKAPFKGAPRYLAIYEVDETSASQRRHVGAPYSVGPAVWQGHRTPWRLWFRTTATPE